MLSSRTYLSGQALPVRGSFRSVRLAGVRSARVSRLAVFDKLVLEPIGDGDVEHLEGIAVPNVGKITLREGVFEVGREPPADIVIPIPTVSATHALVRVGASGVLVTDNGSTNGTYIDGTELEPKQGEKLFVGGEVIFGDMHLAKFRLAEEEEAEPESE